MTIKLFLAGNDSLFVLKLDQNALYVLTSIDIFASLTDHYFWQGIVISIFYDTEH